MSKVDTPSSLRAQGVADALKSADEMTDSVIMHLTRALRYAEEDYDHNADKTRDLLAVARLLRGQTCQESLLWDGYARARRVDA
ncbi:hypothetical protein SEA_LOZINAK_79 [Gordonia phage Lozinak]|uniref:Uncharacterized protein n=5 Tax=Smoothievirus TaxID=1982557 RepID=A0A2D1GFT4_9CAUD|nr:hypothetical protein BEN60_gp127 [Gordonia phage Smoothie]YP_009273113.1 hypothetical protein BH768_gp129 [Gordonia phage ClubL]YP_009276191.1 hypothetical protein BH772_gp131 [Gordonia phage Bachita]YP_009281234.1 hypothetical protein BIZ74_gp125 [Gordonia phage Cucurbita]ATN90705.1 hypothetical protein SEA_LOZINAK_79 [Gordonia phage Lozinak]AUE23586.1 hypothetical protein SEA_TONIANN_79 [Gordonia phage Toniann]QAU06943.1 hypothetical protein SEA_APHELION_78 [Gordonia phage Aphelion]QKY7